jgi:hypothetical protein
VAAFSGTAEMLLLREGDDVAKFGEGHGAMIALMAFWVQRGRFDRSTE